MKTFIEDAFVDVQLIVENPTCPIAKEGGLRACILDIRGRDSDILHLIEFDEECAKEFMNTVEKEDFEIIKEITKRGDKLYALISSKGCPVCTSLTREGSFLVSGKLLEDGKMTFRFIVPGRDALDKIFKELENADIKYDILFMKGLSRKKYLTDNQERTLLLSLRFGLFDHPRRTTLYEVANMLGIRPSTLSETLRRGIKKILEENLYK
jgi:hypothetical protein